jgi:hypothetical protein
VDGRWTGGGREVVGRKKIVTEAGRYGHGSWTVRSRKADGMVTVSGQKRKIYCRFLLAMMRDPRIFINNLSP